MSILLVGCTLSPKPAEKPSEEPTPAPSNKATYTVPTGEDRFKDETYGQETWFAISAMDGKDEPANGVVQAHVFENGAYRLEIQLNIERASEGYFYEAWLVEEGSEPLSIGHLRSRFGDARHTMQFDSDEDLRDMPLVQITLEPDDGDPSPGQLVADGTLVARGR